MSGPYFITPAGVKDYHNQDNYAKWSTFINDCMTRVVKHEEITTGKGLCQFYNPETKPTGKDKQVAIVVWKGFPRRLHGNYELADKKGGWPQQGYRMARNQDEYLEWFVYKNKSGKITRVDFTCESPEYWQHLFEWEPETCLALYQQYISPDVKLDDLSTLDKGIKQYNIYNKWNTTDGCMHLNCPPNSHYAEIRLAGDASIIRKKNGQIITDSQELINCSEYGLADRDSDPTIGSAVNTQCRAGNRITIGNPVCLFIKEVDTAGWTTPDGHDASKYMKLLRGTKEEGLRYSLQVPDSEKFTVGDLKIGGEPIQYGGSVGFLITMGLSAEFCTDEKGAQPAHDCVSAAHELAHPLKKANYVHRSFIA